MSENNTSPRTETDLPEEDDFLYVPEYAPDFTDSDDDEQAIKERINARECNIEEYVMPDMNIFQRTGEFWYRNKPLILAAVGAVLLAVFIIITGMPDHYDLTSTIYVSYSDFPSTITFAMEEEYVSHVSDLDGDGESDVAVSTINLVDPNGAIAAVNMEKLLAHLTDEPTSMLWVIDEELYNMMIRDYGEYLFESFEGAPLWIEITCSEKISSCIERSECPKLGFCLRAMTDELAENEDVRMHYEQAIAALTAIREQHPEMFAA